MYRGLGHVLRIALSVSLIAMAVSPLHADSETLESKALNLDASSGARVRLTCSVPERPASRAIQMSCKVDNKAGEDIVILLSDAALDGPIGTPGYFLDRLPGGQRYENVLQFGIGPKKGFNRTSFSHPWVDLTDDDLGRLRRIAADESVTVEIQVDLDGIEQLATQEEILVRLKLVYATEAKLRSVQLRSDVSESCRQLLGRSLKEARVSDSDQLGTRRLEPGLKMLLDGCHDRISDQFEHVYSVILDVRFPPCL